MDIPKGLAKHDKGYTKHLLENPKPKLEEVSEPEEELEPEVNPYRTKKSVDFSRIVKDKKYRAKYETRCYGAKIFMKKFGGFFGGKRRSEQEALEIIVNIGLATDKNSARDVIKLLKDNQVSYVSHTCRRFILREVKNSAGNKAYRLDYP